jgi:hypothetical protein
MATKRVREWLIVGLGILSPLLLLGSVGALEMDRIGFTQCLIQSSIALFGLYMIGRK